MPPRLGDIWKCVDQACGFEFLVVHDSARPGILKPCPLCCCGQPMLKQP